jgi:glucosamine-6-phosphate deaminase
MKLVVTEDYAAMSRAAADWVAQQVKAKPDAVAVFPTGNSPVGLYEELARRHKAGAFDASRLHLFQLDEYLGLAADDPYSLYQWFYRAFVEPLDVPEGNLVRLAADAPNIEQICYAYDEQIAAAGGFDFAVLGLGPNGHLGYNEPPANSDALTRIVTLTESSIEGAVGYFGSRARVPSQAVTLGMAPLLAARQILLIVNGAHKHDILRRSLTGPITPDAPASYLQKHPDLTVIADRAAWPEG